MGYFCQVVTFPINFGYQRFLLPMMYVIHYVSEVGSMEKIIAVIVWRLVQSQDESLSERWVSFFGFFFLLILEQSTMSHLK